ncbi:MAG: GCN5-related N-acetyltransferase [Glaciihabitans sp.]|nr:GCN5-related N-acetyltransferase [Glaciihabitans sp.]
MIDQPAPGLPTEGTITVRVVETAWDHPDAVLLRAAQRDEIAERYGTNDSEPGPAPTAADITVFYVAYATDGDSGTDAVSEPAGCGALRQLDATSGEIKRMFVSRSRRGSGVSVAIVRQLEDTARQHGWTRLLLETGDAQPDAMRFYSREGYTPIARFGYYVDSESSRCFGKNL